PDRGRLRPGDQRRHLHRGVGGGQRPAGEPPAAPQLLRGEGPHVQRGRRRRPVGHLDLALLAGAVAAAGGGDGDAVPAGGVEHGDAVRHPYPPRAGLEDQVDPGRAVLHVPGVQLGVLHAGHVVACWAPACWAPACWVPACWAWACWARWAAIQAAPQASRSSSRSAALTARTICGDRASMMALVRPAEIAIGRNAAPMVWRSGMPNETVDAPRVMFTPHSSRRNPVVSNVFSPTVVSAPTRIDTG